MVGAHMNELDQWCEIDGHEFIYMFMSYGFFLGQKTEVMHSYCKKCNKSETKHFIQERAKQFPYLIKMNEDDTK